MIVEDNPDILEAISDLLDLEGYEVTRAGSAERALEILSEPATGPFDGLILDNFMPGLNGQEFIEKLAGPESPVAVIPPMILITTNPDVIQAAHLPVRVMLLPKPLDIARLIEMVGKLTGRDLV